MSGDGEAYRGSVLDLFCGAGGAAVGYHRAGFDVIGIDLEPQPSFPFAFIQADALEPPVDLRSFDLIHASPPCQAYTTMNNRRRSDGTMRVEHMTLIGATRKMLQSAGVPYVIENVAGAVRKLVNPIRLTGEMFVLGVHRARYFECEPFILAPPVPSRQKGAVPVYGKLDGRLLWRRKDGSELRAPSSLEKPSEAMGIDWMGWDELRESIPPAYTEYIGRRMLEAVVSDARDPLTGSDAKIAVVKPGSLYQSGRPVPREAVEAYGINAILSVSAAEQAWIEGWQEAGRRELSKAQPAQRIRLQVPLIDASGWLDTHGADAAVEVVCRLLDDPWRSVLVHCDMGAFRSVHICACILARRTGMSGREAFRRVDAARGDGEPRDGLTLAGWDDHLEAYP